MRIRIEMSPSIVELEGNLLTLETVRAAFPTAIGLCAQNQTERFILNLHENVFSPPSRGWNAFERYEVIFAGSEYVWDRLERSLRSIRHQMEHDESPRSDSPVERSPRERVGSFRNRLGNWKNRSDNGYGSMEMCLASKGVNELEKQFAELSAILVGKDAIIDSQRRQLQSERKSNDELKESKQMLNSQKNNWINKCSALESELYLLRQLSGNQFSLGSAVDNLNSEIADTIAQSEQKIDELQKKLTQSEENLENISKKSQLEERSIQSELQKVEIGRCDKIIKQLNATLDQQKDEYAVHSSRLHAYCDNICHENVKIVNDFMNPIPATQAPVHHNQRQVPAAQNVNMGVQNGGATHAPMNSGYYVNHPLQFPNYGFPTGNPVLQLAHNTPVSMQHNEHGTFVDINASYPQYTAFPYTQQGMSYNYMQNQPFYAGPPYPFNSSAPVQKPEEQPQQKQAKPKRVLNFCDPVTKQPVKIDSKDDLKTDTQPPKAAEDGNPSTRLCRQVAAIVTGQTSEKEDIAENRTPEPVDSIEKPKNADRSSPEKAITHTISKSPSVEPEISSIEEEAESPLSQAPSKTPTPTPAPIANGSDTKEISEDQKAVLFKLEHELQAMYDKNSEAIEDKKYDTDFLFIIREIVKTHKKTLPNLNSPDILVAKGLDVSSAQAHQSQNRMKFNTNSFNANSSSVFNPQWAPTTNSSIVGANRKAYAGRHSDNKTRKRGPGVTGRPSMDRAFVRAPPPPPPEQLRKAENAWKPKRRAETEEDDQAKFYAKARKDIRSIFNKITPSTYEELATEFFSLNLEDDEKLQTIAIDLIFEKAVEEPKFCSLYTRICKEQVDRGGRDNKSFFRALIFKCQATFEGSSTFAASVHETKEELEKETDPKKKTDLEERLDLLKNKEKRCLLGNIKFISHLYTAKLLSDAVVSSCAYKLRYAYLETKDEIYVQYGTELLELVAGIYFSQDSTQKRQKNNDTDNVEAYIHWLLSDELRETLSTRVRVMIMNFDDFRKRGYVPRNAEKGPTTLAELRDDVKKQEERNKDERLAYESRHKERRERPYASRASLDKKNLTEKRMSAAVASSNVGNSSMKRLGTIRGENAKLGLPNSTSYFNKHNTNEAQRESTPVAEEDADGGWTHVGNCKAGNASQSRQQSQERKSVTPAPSQ